MGFAKKLIAHQVPVLIFDRVSIISSPENRLTVQNVPKSIYKASYPCWFFSEERFLEAIGPSYELIEKFESSVKNETWIDGKTRASDWGFVFQLKH